MNLTRAIATELITLLTSGRCRSATMSFLAQDLEASELTRLTFNRAIIDEMHQQRPDICVESLSLSGPGSPTLVVVCNTRSDNSCYEKH